MKKLLLIMTIVAISACGVQRPLPLTISLITPSADPFASQGGLKVSTSSLYNVRVDWDISNTNAHGIKILAAASTDYDCDEPIATAMVLGIPNSKANTTNMYQSLAHIFISSGVNLSVFTMGEYALCLVSVQYDNESSPSIPVFMTLTQNQAPTMGYQTGLELE